MNGEGEDGGDHNGIGHYQMTNLFLAIDPDFFMVT